MSYSLHPNRAKGKRETQNGLQKKCRNAHLTQFFAKIGCLNSVWFWKVFYILEMRKKKIAAFLSLPSVAEKKIKTTDQL